PSATRYSFNFRPEESSVNRRGLFSTKILSAVVGVIAAGFWRASYKEIAVVAINAPANATERKRRKFELLIQIGPFGARLAVLGCRSRRSGNEWSTFHRCDRSKRDIGHLTGQTLERKILDRKSTRLNSSHGSISYAVYCYGHHRNLHPFPTRRSSDLNATERKRRKFELLIQIGPFGARLAVLGCRSRRSGNEWSTFHRCDRSKRDIGHLTGQTLERKI